MIRLALRSIPLFFRSILAIWWNPSLWWDLEQSLAILAVLKRRRSELFSVEIKGACASEGSIGAGHVNSGLCMRMRISNLRCLEIVLLAAGALLVGYAGFKYTSGQVYSRVTLAMFHVQAAEQPAKQSDTGTVAVKSLIPADFSLWSQQRIEKYQAVLAEHFETPIGVLRVKNIHMEVPVFDGTSDRILNRGVGRIVGTTQIGQIGNTGIAGHRDGFFRGLKDVKLGDTVQLETTKSTQVYVIDSIKVVRPDDVSMLKNEPTPALTLVTCYPFYFVGSAPNRYIVHASLKGEINTTNEPAKASLQATASTKEKTQ